MSERLLDPTSVVLNSFPTFDDAMLAGDWVGEGRYTIVPALGLMWLRDSLRFGVPDFRSWRTKRLKKISEKEINWVKLTCSWVVLNVLMKCWLFTSSTSCWNGDCDGDGCKRGLCCTEGDGLGVRNGPGGDKIPKRQDMNKHQIFRHSSANRPSTLWPLKLQPE